MSSRALPIPRVQVETYVELRELGSIVNTSWKVVQT